MRHFLLFIDDNLNTKNIFTLCVIIFLVISSNLNAQISTGMLQGVVKDTLNKPIPVAEIILKDVNSGITLGGAASVDGKYIINKIPPGVYDITVQHLGYVSVVRPDVEIQIGQTIGLDFTMKATAIQLGKVEVTAAQPVDIHRTDVSTVIRERQIEELPLDSRNFIDLSSLAPGVRSYPGGEPSYGSYNQYRFLNVYVDGAEWKNRFNSNTMGNVQKGVVPQSAIKEFRFLSNAYDAEYGRGAGFIVTAVTKRGSNTMHGSAFYNYRNRELNSRGPFEVNKPEFRYGQMGISISGPIMRNKLFYAATYERHDLTNIIQTSPGEPSYNPTMWNQYAQSADAPSVDNLWVFRLTGQLWKNHIDDIIWDARRSKLESSWGGLRPKEGGIINDQAVDNVLFKDRWVLSNVSSNETILQFIRWNVDPVPQSLESERRYPDIILGGQSSFPRTLMERAIRIKDNYSYNIRNWGGDHLFKAGLEFTYHTVDVNYALYYRPILFFSTDTSTIPYRAQIAVGTNDRTGNSDARSLSNAKFFSLYFQDDWHPTSKLTINLGIRWDGSIDAMNNNFVSPLLGDTTITNHIDSRYINDGNRKNNLFDIAPRFGFSYDIFGNNRTTIRGGFGIFYDRVAYVYPYYEKRDVLWRTYTINNPGTTDPNVLRQMVISGNGNAKPNLTLMDRNLKDPKVREFSVGFSHSFTRSLVINVDYVNNYGNNYYSDYNANYYMPSIKKYAITQDFGSISIWGNFGTNFYQALLVGLQKPYSNGWMLQVSYALSEARSQVEVPESGYTFLSSFKDAYSSLDELHRLTVNGIIDLPLGFRASGIFSLASPRPIAATIGMDLNNDNNFNDDWPNDQRNSVRPDINKLRNWFKNFDLKISKSFLTSVGTLQISIESYNLFNWTDYSSFGSRMYDAKGNPIITFGMPVAAYPARQIQFGIKAQW